MRIDPPPSPPVASVTRPPATAAALPPDEPPGVRDGSHGLPVAPWSSGAGDVDAAELAGRRLAGQHGPAVVDQPGEEGRGVRRHLVGEHDAGVGGRPAGHVVQLLDAHRARHRRASTRRPPRPRPGRPRWAGSRTRSGRWRRWPRRWPPAPRAACAHPDGRPRRASRRRPATACPPCRRPYRAARSTARCCPDQTGRRTVAARWTPAPSSACARATTPTAGRWRSAPGWSRGAASCSAAAASARPSRRWRARAAASASGPRRSTSRTRPRGEVVDVDVTIAVEGHQITQARAVVPRREPGDPDRQRRARPPSARAGRAVGAPPGRPAPSAGLPAPAAARADRRDDQRAAGPAHRQGSRAGTSSTAARRRPGAGLDAHPRRARRRRRHRARRARRLRAHGRGPGARASSAAATASTTRCGSCTSCPPSGCCSTSGCTPSSGASATASSTCSPRTARCWRRPARAASCGSGTSGAAAPSADPGGRNP